MRTTTAFLAAALALGAVAARAQAIFGVGSSAAEASHVVKAAAGALYGFHVDTGAAAVWVMVVDGTTAPADGALTGCVTGATARPCLLSRYQVPANLTAAVTFDPAAQLPFTTGLVLVCSSTGPFTKTATATCTFSNVQYR